MSDNNIINEPFKPKEDNNNNDNNDNNDKNNNVINSFPNWDLLPPYQTVRRINRK